LEIETKATEILFENLKGGIHFGDLAAEDNTITLKINFYGD
jgi:ribosome-associated toxin RatA of RatAB toxin-antitoxin module